MTNTPIDFRPSGSIDFEHVVIAPPAAQNAAAPAVPVDDRIDTDALSINFGRDKDTRPTAVERMLGGPTIDWLIAFPLDARPKALCDRFPHVANRLAKGWKDKAVSATSVQALAGDARWGTAGFPAQVQSELQRLLAMLAPAA